jgi:prefoldin beta subunit
MEKDKLQKMQIFQENLQSILMQKQAFQMEMDETLSAIREVESSKDDVYKLVGQLMIKIKKEKITEELEEKRKVIHSSLEKLEADEEKISSELKKIRDEIIKESKNRN